MTDTSTGTSAGTPSTSAARRDRFEQDLQSIGHRTNRADRTLAVGGAVAMAFGIVVAIVGYLASTGQADTRDVISSGILATIGLTIAIVGAALFVRGSLTQFLRFWMLRMLYEQQRQGDGPLSRGTD